MLIYFCSRKFWGNYFCAFMSVFVKDDDKVKFWIETRPSVPWIPAFELTRSQQEEKGFVWVRLQVECVLINLCLHIYIYIALSFFYIYLQHNFPFSEDKFWWISGYISLGFCWRNWLENACFASFWMLTCISSLFILKYNWSIKKAIT